MCVIIDTNVASNVFRQPCCPQYAPLWNWIQNEEGRIVFGGPLARELAEIGQTRRRLLELLRAGKARRVRDELITAEEARVRACGQGRSNDAHVIALARVSCARILCSADRNLHMDFRNQHLINHPRGVIYQNQSHGHLLRHHNGCR